MPAHENRLPEWMFERLYKGEFPTSDQKLFDIASKPTPVPTPISLEDGLTNFEVVKLALDRIYDLAGCDGADTISLMIQVASDHLGIIQQKIENKDAEAAKRVLKANVEGEQLRALLREMTHCIDWMNEGYTINQYDAFYERGELPARQGDKQ